MLIHAPLGPGPALLNPALELQTAESDFQKVTTPDPCLAYEGDSVLSSSTMDLPTVLPRVFPINTAGDTGVPIEMQLFRPNPRPAGSESAFQ